MVALHAFDRVKLGEVLVEHRKVRFDHVVDAQVVLQQVVEKMIGLLLHVGFDKPGERRVTLNVDLHGLVAINSQPVIGEGFDHVARVG